MSVTFFIIYLVESNRQGHSQSGQSPESTGDATRFQTSTENHKGICREDDH